MKNRPSSDHYDAIIIGAGIGGLVCGCYLAKAGMKVLICEQHHKPGGYCTSFTRGNYTFDAAAHSIGGIQLGNLGRIYEELGVIGKLKLMRRELSNMVISPDYTVRFWDNALRTIEELQSKFPAERKNISNFFETIMVSDPTYNLSLKSAAFIDILDSHFSDVRLKSILSFPVFGNGGLPPSHMSAFLGIKIFREFLLDGGYYIEAGIQHLADVIVQQFQEFGGEFLHSVRVRKILVSERIANGIAIDENVNVFANYVISNCDAKETFHGLIGRHYVPEAFLQQLDSMMPSLSVFTVYLGVDDSFSFPSSTAGNIWYLHDYDLDAVYSSICSDTISRMDSYLLHLMPERRTITALALTPSRTPSHWNATKMLLANSLMTKIQADLFPELSAHVDCIHTSTPATLEKYTGNAAGSAYGWAPLPSQFALTDFKRPSFLTNFFSVGHWTTMGLGIPGVSYIGYDTARLVMRRQERSRSRCIEVT